MIDGAGWTVARSVQHVKMWMVSIIADFGFNLLKMCLSEIWMESKHIRQLKNIQHSGAIHIISSISGRNIKDQQIKPRRISFIQNPRHVKQ